LCASACALSSESDPVANDVLTSILAGDLLCAFGELTGGAIARVVDGAPQADIVIVVDRDAECLLLCADRSSWSVNASGGAGLRHFDVSRSCGDVTVNTDTAHRLCWTDHALTLRRLLLAADALGGLQRMLDRTVAYAAQRQSFGRPIGGLQSVQHRLVDHSVRARGMSLVVAEAAKALTEQSPDAERLVTSAELSVSSSPTILHDLVQLTGAIGFTWEYGLHLYERRAHQDARLGSNPRAAAGRLASLEGWTRGH
jgi:alkylation response protein AidB-like acyl-CoA dehydrogenase